MTVEELLPRLDAVRRSSQGYMARCPAHQDNNPSLSIGEGTDRILLHCFALCKNQDIVAALSLTMADLFFHKPTTQSHRPTAKPLRIDRAALSSRFELAALERRLRAERVNLAIRSISINDIPDNDLDRLVDAVGCAYADIERATLFEAVADDLRLKAFAQRERTDRYAA